MTFQSHFKAITVSGLVFCSSSSLIAYADENGPVFLTSYYIGCNASECERIDLDIQSEEFEFVEPGFSLDEGENRRSRGDTKKFVRALSKFDNTAKCMMDADRGLLSYDLTTINWDALSNRYEAAVCISRVAHEIHSTEHLAIWLERVGFDVRLEDLGPRSPIGTTRLFTKWVGLGDNPLSWRYFGYIFGRSDHQLAVTIDENGYPVDVAIYEYTR